MKRKGFTLVELLIIIAIIGALSATMMVGLGGSTARAKAVTISNNVESMKLAAANYYITNMEDASQLNVDTAAMLDAEIPTWRDFAEDAKIKYTASTDTGREKWLVTVDFTGDGESDLIKTELAKIKGYGTYAVGSGTADDKLATKKFKVTLWNGKIEKAD